MKGASALMASTCEGARTGWLRGGHVFAGRLRGFGAVCGAVAGRLRGGCGAVAGRFAGRFAGRVAGRLRVACDHLGRLRRRDLL